MKPFILANDSSGATFTLGNALKDMTYYMALTHELNATNGLAQATQSLFAAVAVKGQQARAIPELIAILSDNKS
jgi:3-hydroxyisobutyrate dehydrogenase